jgi:hypothetical protein
MTAMIPSTTTISMSVKALRRWRGKVTGQRAPARADASSDPMIRDARRGLFTDTARNFFPG